MHARITQRQVVVASRQLRFVSQAITFDPFVPIPFKDELIPIERTPRCNNPKLTCTYIRIVVNQMSKAFLNQAPHSSSRVSLHRVCWHPRLHQTHRCITNISHITQVDLNRAIPRVVHTSREYIYWGLCDLYWLCTGKVDMMPMCVVCTKWFGLGLSCGVPVP